VFISAPLWALLQDASERRAVTAVKQKSGSGYVGAKKQQKNAR
jgi:hypothetical protein